ncbi:VanZ family protein [Flavobacterium sp. '19STA2R22 D10 B1']|uniref:VanZ family protein n=1 Tax=Flavobacterium aerium TaxID=3037261 RepID=UPI00278C84B3|nr:VanZ family protein [Flavobacterium sp. '19STA2R22 D10 B1']
MGPKNIFFGLALFWTIFITLLSLMRFSEVPKIEVENVDKYVHFIFYFGFTMLWYLGLSTKFNTVKKEKIAAIALGIAVVYGIMIEVIQGMFTVSRNADVYDAIANTCGSIFAILVLGIYYKLKKK